MHTLWFCFLSLQSGTYQQPTATVLSLPLAKHDGQYVLFDVGWGDPLFELPSPVLDEEAVDVGLHIVRRIRT